MPLKSFLTFLMLLFFGLTSVVSGQQYDLRTLGRINEKYAAEGKFEEALEFNLSALEFFKSNKNNEGIASADIFISNYMDLLGKYDLGLKYLDDAKNHIDAGQNPFLYSKLYTNYGVYYSKIHLFRESNKNLDKALVSLKKVKDQENRKKFLYHNYSWKWYNFEMLKMPDSAYSMRDRCLKYATDPTMTYIKIADDFITRKVHLDSAEYYLNKSLSSNLTKAQYSTSKTLENFGHLFKVKGDYQKALSYYLQSLEISQRSKHKTDVREGFKNVSDIYKFLGNSEESDRYFLKFTVLNDSINLSEKKVMAHAVKRILQEQKQEEQKEKKRLYAVAGGIIILLLTVFFVIRRKYLKHQKNKDRLIETQTQQVEVLKKKAGDAYDEIIQLAKEGDPFFMVKFKEIFHEFYEKLMAHTPDLTDHDLKSCAYIKLNLDNKDISRLENVTVRAIQTKRYRLKKKLNLPAEVDLVTWINTL